MQAIRRSFQTQELSEQAIEMLLKGWSTGTKKQYEPYIAKFLRYCTERCLDPFQASVSTVVEFLVHMFHDTGVKYSAINTARSALSSFLPPIGGVTVGNHPLVKRLMRGVFKERPALPKYINTYDVDVVLRYLDKLGPANSLPINRLTERLATLLCILSGQRDQTLQFIDVRNIFQTETSCTIVIGELIKNTRPGFHVDLSIQYVLL